MRVLSILMLTAALVVPTLVVAGQQPCPDESLRRCREANHEPQAQPAPKQGVPAGPVTSPISR